MNRCRRSVTCPEGHNLERVGIYANNDLFCFSLVIELLCKAANLKLPGLVGLQSACGHQLSINADIKYIKSGVQKSLNAGMYQHISASFCRDSFDD